MIILSLMLPNFAFCIQRSLAKYEEIRKFSNAHNFFSKRSWTLKLSSNSYIQYHNLYTKFQLKIQQKSLECQGGLIQPPPSPSCNSQTPALIGLISQLFHLTLLDHRMVQLVPKMTHLAMLVHKLAMSIIKLILDSLLVKRRAHLVGRINLLTKEIESI